MFLCSLFVLCYYFIVVVCFGVVGMDFDVLCWCGIVVEIVMLCVIVGVNIYCGVVFSFGFLVVVVVVCCFCLGYVVMGEQVCQEVCCWFVEFVDVFLDVNSFGQCVCVWYGVQGVCE